MDGDFKIRFDLKEVAIPETDDLLTVPPPPVPGEEGEEGDNGAKGDKGKEFRLGDGIAADTDRRRVALSRGMRRNTDVGTASFVGWVKTGNDFLRLDCRLLL